MSKFDWRKTVGAIAPGIATALGGPLAGAAVSALGRALLGNDKATESEIEAAIAGATPADLLKLREADNAFKLEMEKLGVDLERVHAGDRDSARKMQVSTNNFMPALLGILVTIGFFGALTFVITHGLPEQGRDAALLMLGSLGTAWTAIISFYYGSTKSSAEKTRLLAQADAVK